MAWFRRRRRLKMAPFNRSSLPEAPPASFEEMRDEGVLMAESAARMTLKNRLIVDALANGVGFDEGQAETSARDVLLVLEQEAEGLAVLVGVEREAAARRDGRAEHEHDYKRGDAWNLRRRQKVYEGVAAELRSLRQDPEYIAELTAQSRESAWADIAGAIEQELDRRFARFDEELDYEIERVGRLEDFTDDLRRELRRAEARRAVEAIPEY